MHIMKRLFKISKIKFLVGLFALGALNLSLAQTPLAVVQEVSGGAFMTTPKGQTIAVQKGQHIYDFAQIRTTLGAQVSFNDYYDHKFHLSGAGSIKFMNKVVELRRGYLWVQSLGQNNHGFYIQTANAQVELSSGEGILSFDPGQDKTQFLSLKGGFIFGNLMDAQLNVKVQSGQFSFVDLEYQDGVPRVSTPVGQESFSKIVGLFNQVKPMDGTPEASRYQFIAHGQEDEKPKRTPASAAPRPKEKTKVHFLPLKHAPKLQRKRKSLLNSYSSDNERKGPSPNRAPAKSKKIRPSGDGVPLNVYGVSDSLKKDDSMKNKRIPASVKPSREVEKIIQQARKPASYAPKKQMDAFERVLQKEYKQQKKHPEEVNQLIDELKSFEQDFRQGY